MKESDVRRSPRKRIEFPIQVPSIARESRIIEELRSHPYVGTSISAGGLGLRTGAPVLAGDLLTVQFTLPGETRALTLSARVKRVTRAEGQLPRFDVNLSFEGITRDESTYLTNYLGTTFLLV